MNALPYILAACLAGCIPTTTPAEAQAQTNRDAWLAAYPDYSAMDLLHRGEVVKAPECPNGARWLRFYVFQHQTAAVQTIALYCGTASSAQGCMLEEAFMASGHANTVGQCMGAKP